MAQEIDILKPEFRTEVLSQITANENDWRKNESRRRFEIWNGNLHEEVKKQMMIEYSLTTIEKFRTQTSINLVPRIIDEKASIYKSAPTREFKNVSDEQVQYILDAYKDMMVNVVMKKANKFFKLQNQDTIQLLPIKNKLKPRILQPHHYDVIPDNDDLTAAMVTIVGLNDENRHISTFIDSTERKLNRNFLDEIIGDWDDKRKLLARFAWWTDNFNFITDGFGDIKSDPDDLDNGLKVSPFVEVSDPATKDFTYWVLSESLLTRFQIDFCKDLTDITENGKMQGHNQGVIIAVKKPETVDIGPRKWIFLPLDPNNPDARPSFEFKAPRPDLTGAMSILQDKLAMYLSSDGIDPDTVAAKGSKITFNSGTERLLAQLQKFEASSDDLDLFEKVETNFFELYKKINNRMAEEGIEDFEMIPDDAEMSVKFIGPEKVETQEELETRWIRLRDEGFATGLRSIMEIYKVDKEKAIEIKKEIDEEKRQPTEPDLDDDKDNKNEKDNDKDS